jgi:branched-chain amino acid transport system permease protein
VNEQLLQQGFNVLSSASIYALVAIGLSVIFGLSGIINIAYGDFMTLGAYVVFVVAPGGAIAFVWGFAASAVAVAVLSIAVERALFRWTVIRPVNGFLVSLGLSQIIENGVAWHFGQDSVTVAPADSANWTLGGVVMSADRVIIILGTVVLVVGLILFLDRTQTGTAIRAIAADREAAALMGIPVTRLVTGVFALGGLIAGLGGGFVALLQPPYPLLGAELVLKGFVVALVGGLGSVRGAVIGAVLLAFIETVLVTAGLAGWLDVIEFGAVILLLIIRPQGLARGLAHSM